MTHALTVTRAYLLLSCSYCFIICQCMCELRFTVTWQPHSSDFMIFLLLLLLLFLLLHSPATAVRRRGYVWKSLA